MSEERWICPDCGLVERGPYHLRTADKKITPCVAVRFVPASRIEELERELAAKHEWALGLLARAVDAEAKCERLEAGVKLIAEHPTEQRNPDGDEQAAWSMRQIARDLLSIPKTEGER